MTATSNVAKNLMSIIKENDNRQEQNKKAKNLEEKIDEISKLLADKDGVAAQIKQIYAYLNNSQSKDINVNLKELITKNNKLTENIQKDNEKRLEEYKKIDELSRQNKELLGSFKGLTKGLMTDFGKAPKHNYNNLGQASAGLEDSFIKSINDIGSKIGIKQSLDPNKTVDPLEKSKVADQIKDKLDSLEKYTEEEKQLLRGFKGNLDEFGDYLLKNKDDIDKLKDKLDTSSKKFDLSEARRAIEFNIQQKKQDEQTKILTDQQKILKDLNAKNSEFLGSASGMIKGLMTDFGKPPANNYSNVGQAGAGLENSFINSIQSLGKRMTVGSVLDPNKTHDPLQKRSGITSIAENLFKSIGDKNNQKDNLSINHTMGESKKQILGRSSEEKMLNYLSDIQDDLSKIKSKTYMKELAHEFVNYIEENDIDLGGHGHGGSDESENNGFSLTDLIPDSASRLWRKTKLLGRKLTPRFLRNGMYKLGKIPGKALSGLSKIPGVSRVGGLASKAIGGLSKIPGVSAASNFVGKLAGPALLAAQMGYGAYQTAFDSNKRADEAHRLGQMGVGGKIVDTLGFGNVSENYKDGALMGTLETAGDFLSAPVQWGKNIGSVAGFGYDILSSKLEQGRTESKAGEVAKSLDTGFADKLNRYKSTMNESSAKAMAAQQTLGLLGIGPASYIATQSKDKEGQLADELSTTINKARGDLSLDKDGKFTNINAAKAAIESLKSVSKKWDELKKLGGDRWFTPSWLKDKELMAKGDSLYKGELQTYIKILEDYSAKVDQTKTEVKVTPSPAVTKATGLPEVKALAGLAGSNIKDTFSSENKIGLNESKTSGMTIEEYRKKQEQVTNENNANYQKVMNELHNRNGVQQPVKQSVDNSSGISKDVISRFKKGESLTLDEIASIKEEDFKSLNKREQDDLSQLTKRQVSAKSALDNANARAQANISEEQNRKNRSELAQANAERNAAERNNSQLASRQKIIDREQANQHNSSQQSSESYSQLHQLSSSQRLNNEVKPLQVQNQQQKKEEHAQLLASVHTTIKDTMKTNEHNKPQQPNVIVNNTSVHRDDNSFNVLKTISLGSIGG